MSVTSEAQARVEDFCRAFERGDTDALLAPMDEEVVWTVDWKGEGIFGGGDLFGRHVCRGPAEVAAFQDRLGSELDVVHFEAERILADEEETIVFGDAEWTMHTDGRRAKSDWTLRWVVRDGRIVKGRLMTLPEDHIRTFVEDDLHRDLYSSQETIREVVRRFQKLYFDAYLFGKTWAETYFLGTPIFKCPLDLWVYQEMVYRLRPDFIVETGTNYGGSARYFGTLCDLVGHGEVITVDVTDHYNAGDIPRHERVRYLLGSSTSEEVVREIRRLVAGAETVLVVLDSDHHAEHVLAELRAYEGLVTRGSYLVVEDSNLNGNPVKQNYGPGPREAIEEFLRETSDFIVDREPEKFLMTFNPGGFLKRVR